MYRGFNIKFNSSINEKYKKIGRESQQSDKALIKENFERYLIDSDSYNGNLIMDNWFPIKEHDVFLSHSHKDEETALLIAGLLKETHGLNVFVDSSVWLNSTDLLKIIDNRFCLNEDKAFYDYNLRNFSTSHVYMMLMNSLNKMIDKSEALFFLNTPNSISAQSVVTERTLSPWIYSELETSKIIKKKTPERIYRKTKYFNNYQYVALNESADKSLQINYELDLGHLTEINTLEFNEWLYGNYISPTTALDKLYNKKQLPNIKFLD